MVNVEEFRLHLGIRNRRVSRRTSRRRASPRLLELLKGQYRKFKARLGSRLFTMVLRNEEPIVALYSIVNGSFGVVRVENRENEMAIVMRCPDSNHPFVMRLMEDRVEASTADEESFHELVNMVDEVTTSLLEDDDYISRMVS